MRRFLRAVSDLRLSAFSNDLSTSFKINYIRMCRLFKTQGLIYYSEDDITEEDAAYLREMLTRAEVEAAEKAKRRHEQVKWVSVAVAEMAKAFRRLVPSFN